ncbi:nucleoside diphosphate kinase regulator [Saccharophagus sp. K07]|jgi:regulator of nucleoside diphosphate kinase|uniref:nucleoside diphosphate kinase regulator n=1 Tax=Saccharophagus sp. K07 TaxID=2283636 RepID=UPI001652018D|nr:nucleoside diphosphate kinase regulator [Saccharophagus sp. K07]MBC6905306.1 nucleoside diphosphate kinase regulator [Saccharophagus sp. K07]
MTLAQRDTEPVSIVISKQDYQRLMPLLRDSELELAEALEEELSRADIVGEEELPKDAVSMYSTVTFRDLDAQTDTTVTLVFPAEANMAEKKISILSPVGVALLGLRIGGRIRWPMPNGKQKHIEILSVQQP